MYKNFLYLAVLCLLVVGCNGTSAQDCDRHSKKMRAYQSTRLAIVTMNNPDTTPDKIEELCDGSGYITHGDGHKTKCPGCAACESKDGQEPMTADMEPEYNVYHFGAEWCGPCVKMKKETWADPKMVKFLKENKVKLFMFDADNKKHEKFFEFYKVSSYPTVVLVDVDKLSKVMFKSAGFMNSETAIKKLDETIPKSVLEN